MTRIPYKNTLEEYFVLLKTIKLIINKTSETIKCEHGSELEQKLIKLFGTTDKTVITLRTTIIVC